jgi:hypothetical protein
MFVDAMLLNELHGYHLPLMLGAFVPGQSVLAQAFLFSVSLDVGCRVGRKKPYALAVRLPCEDTAHRCFSFRQRDTSYLYMSLCLILSAFCKTVAVTTDSAILVLLLLASMGEWRKQAIALQECHRLKAPGGSPPTWDRSA